MKKISRDQAEKIFLDSEVLKTKINQTENELRVSMTLSGNKSCLIVFDIQNQKKTYFLNSTK